MTWIIVFVGLCVLVVGNVLFYNYQERKLREIGIELQTQVVDEVDTFLLHKADSKPNKKS